LNKKVKERNPTMRDEEYDKASDIEKDVIKTLHAAFETGEPGGELAQKAADLHRQWLSCYWDKYSKEAHVGAAQMYVDDPRFAGYYDKEQPGTSKFLRDAVLIYTGMR
jgi:hypothetical protein